MIRYAHSLDECRSQLIAAYFGDQSTKPCGICDNCLSQKNPTMTKEEFDFIQRQITQWVNSESIPTQELIGRFSGIRREKLREVINLQR